MQNPHYPQSEPSGRPDELEPSGRAEPFDRPDPSDPPKTARMSGALVFALVVVTVHALGSALGGWAALDENYSKQEHNQDLIMPMAAAWFIALVCWGLAAFQIACVVLARERRSWVRVALAAPMMFVAVSMAFGLLLSLAAGTPGIVPLVIFVLDVVALRVVLGGTGRRWFAVRGSAPDSPRGR